MDGASTARTIAEFASAGLLLIGCQQDGSGLGGGASHGVDAGPEANGCTPGTCLALAIECGSAPDGCGGVVDCGPCPTGQLCGGAGPNMCGTEPCNALTCQQAALQCGVASDQCGGVLQCGNCPEDGPCTQGRCAPEVSLTTVPACHDGIVEGLQLTVRCPLSSTDIPVEAVMAHLGSNPCWFSAWESSAAVFSCLAPGVDDAGSGSVVAACSLDAALVVVTGVQPQTTQVTVCGAKTFWNGTTCKNTQCASATTPFKRATANGWGTVIEGPYGSVACCPANYCAGGEVNHGDFRCYAPGSIFRTNEADAGLWNYDDGAWVAWICGNYAPHPAGYSFNPCNGANAGKTFTDTGGGSFCCTLAKDGDGTWPAYRFMPGACPTGTSD
jgi:hypothetical protein